MNNGRIEQAGTPRELYDRPANEFVMSFIGPVNRLGDAFVRPHDIHVSTKAAAGAQRASLERVVSLGFETRIVATPQDGSEPITVQLTRNQVHELSEVGSKVYLTALADAGESFVRSALRSRTRSRRRRSA